MNLRALMREEQEKRRQVASASEEPAAKKLRPENTVGPGGKICTTVSFRPSKLTQETAAQLERDFEDGDHLDRERPPAQRMAMESAVSSDVPEDFFDERQETVPDGETSFETFKAEVAALEQTLDEAEEEEEVGKFAEDEEARYLENRLEELRKAREAISREHSGRRECRVAQVISHESGVNDTEIAGDSDEEERLLDEALYSEEAWRKTNGVKPFST